MKIKSIQCMPPSGKLVDMVELTGTGLWIDRNLTGLENGIVDIRDRDKPCHEGGFDHLTAQVPTSWMIVPVYEVE